VVAANVKLLANPLAKHLALLATKFAKITSFFEAGTFVPVSFFLKNIIFPI